MAAEIRVVVGCTDRKSVPVTDHLRLGNVAPTTDRIKVWQERIENAPCRSAAGNLYAGEAWSVARSLPTTTQTGETISRWIVSAGYGLIQYSDPISPYSAAFAPGGPDSVAVRGESHAAGQWWDELSKWRPPGIFGPRSCVTSPWKIQKHQLSSLSLPPISRRSGTISQTPLRYQNTLLFSVGQHRLASRSYRATPGSNRRLEGHELR